mmetsp:Transcript_44029/g.82309  ORF Transcript_44029/g.82309 Transcript_44029/m.82309 type:complete len:191 (-) Transcript_44029:76-648(-)
MRALTPRQVSHPWRRCRAGQANQGLCNALAPVERLQEAFDEVLLRPWRFPEHVQNLHQVAEVERAQRAAVVDQSAIAPGKRTLLELRKVVYAIVSRESPHLQVCVTRVCCAQDFLERAARELRADMRGGSFTQSSKHRYGAAKTGLAFQAPEGLLLYALESLDSADLSYHRLSQPRLHCWAKLLQGVTAR